LLLPLLARPHRHAPILQTKPVDTSTLSGHESELAPRAARRLRNNAGYARSVEPQRLKRDHFQLTVCLKAYPDTNREFFRSLLGVGFGGCGAQDGQMVAWVGAKRNKLWFVLNVVQILAGFDGSQEQIERLVALPAKFIDKSRVVQVRWVCVVSCLHRLQFLESPVFVSTLGQIHRQVYAQLGLIGILGNFFPYQLDGMLISRFSLVPLVAGPALGIAQVAPTVVLVSSEFHCLLKGGNRRVVLALIEQNGS
jgi:hypothetical protein